MPAKSTAFRFPLATLLLVGTDADENADRCAGFLNSPESTLRQLEAAAENRGYWLNLATTSWEAAFDADAARCQLNGIPSMWC